VAARVPEFVGTVALARLRGRVGFFMSNSTVDMEHVDPDSRLLLEGIPEPRSDSGGDGGVGIVRGGRRMQMQMLMPTASVLGTSFAKTDVPASVGHFDSLSVAVTDASGSLAVSGDVVSSGEPPCARRSCRVTADASAQGWAPVAKPDPTAAAAVISASEFLPCTPEEGEAPLGPRALTEDRIPPLPDSAFSHASAASALTVEADTPSVTSTRCVGSAPAIRIPRGCPSGAVIVIDQLTAVRVSALHPDAESVAILLPEACSVAPGTTVTIVRCCDDRMPRIDVSSTDGTPVVGGHLRADAVGTPVSGQLPLPFAGALELPGSAVTLTLVTPLNAFGNAGLCWVIVGSPVVVQT
jgi:hypothetical protein